MSKHDSSTDILVYHLLRGTHHCYTDEEKRLDIHKEVEAFLTGQTLPDLFVVPERATRWLRDAHLRAFITLMPGGAPWHRACNGKKLIDEFIAAQMKQWLAHLSTNGRRPKPLMLDRWLITVVHTFAVQCTTREQQHLLMASGVGLPLPQSSRSLYNIHTAPISPFAKRIEREMTKWK